MNENKSRCDITLFMRDSEIELKVFKDPKNIFRGHLVIEDFCLAFSKKDMELVEYFRYLSKLFEHTASSIFEQLENKE